MSDEELDDITGGSARLIVISAKESDFSKPESETALRSNKDTLGIDTQLFS